MTDRAPRGGTMYGQSNSILHGEGPDFHRPLDDAEERYSSTFQELGPGALGDLKGCVDSVEVFLDLLFDGETRPTVKVANYAKAKSDALKHEIHEILERALSWWQNKKSTTLCRGDVDE